MAVIYAVAVVSPDGEILNTVSHDGTPFVEGTTPPPSWDVAEGTFPAGTVFVPIEDKPLSVPVEAGGIYDTGTGEFASASDAQAFLV